MPMSERVIINFVGEPASGKDFACARLAQLGCRIHRPSDALREYAKANAIALMSDRQQMAVLHKQLTTKDPFALARGALSGQSDVAISGLRCPSEINFLRREAPNFGAKLIVVALACESPIVRFNRAMAAFNERGQRDPTNLQDFVNQAAGELYNPDQSRPNVRRLMNEADFTIDTLRLGPAGVIEVVDAIYAHA